MKKWLTVNFFSAGTTIDEPPVISKKEFYIEISLVAMAVALFGILLHVVGA